jgi:hypothetical protein
MPSRAEIVSFDDSPPPPGADPWVAGAVPGSGIEVTGPDPAWPRLYNARKEQVIRGIYHRAFTAAGLLE